MKRLLIALLFALPAMAGPRDWGFYPPHIPVIDPPQVNTFCASNLACTISATQTYSATAPFQGLMDWNSCTMNTWSDPNGAGVGAAANRQACYRFRQTNAVANDATSIANGVFYFGGQLTCLSAAECHHFLVYPVIVRGTGGNFKDVLTGSSFAAPIAPLGDASTTTAGIAASVSFESNPPSSWVTLGCTGCLNTFQTAQTNLGQNTFNVLIKSGGLALGSAINLLAAGNGIRQGVGDMEINNFDTTAAGTISFYNAGSIKSQMANTGIWTHKNSAIWNYATPTINLNGTEGSAHNWSVSESAGQFLITDVSSGAVRALIQTPGNNALFNAVVGYGLGASGTAVLISATAPTIAAAGCGGGAASIVVSNGTGAFKINVGTTPGSACTFTMPAAITGWNCYATDITTNSTSVFLQKQTGAESQTSVTITNFNDVAVATAFTASDILKVACTAD